MRHWSVIPLAAMAFVIACGGRLAPDEVASDAGATSVESGASCTSCQSNEDCQSACAPTEGTGTACCDVASGTCFFTKSSVCDAVDDSGADTSTPDRPQI